MWVFASSHLWSLKTVTSKVVALLDRVTLRYTGNSFLKKSHSIKFPNLGSEEREAVSRKRKRQYFPFLNLQIPQDDFERQFWRQNIDDDLILGCHAALSLGNSGVCVFVCLDGHQCLNEQSKRWTLWIWSTQQLGKNIFLKFWTSADNEFWTSCYLYLHDLAQGITYSWHKQC